LAANANLSLSGSAQKRLNGAVLNQAGSTVWTGSGILTGLNGAVLTNSGRFDIRTDAAMPYGGGAGASLYNLGTVLKSSGGGTNLCDFAFNNNGVLNVQIGAVALHAGGSSSGVFSNAALAKVEFTGGTHTLNGGMSITGAGRGR